VKYQGLHVEVPIHGRQVEVKAHPSVQPEFGSGVVMICSYGDYTDVLLFREMKLKEITAINEEQVKAGENHRKKAKRIRAMLRAWEAGSC
jgi:valyl-tRNA synthetase